jgi:hypothetical protein
MYEYTYVAGVGSEVSNKANELAKQGWRICSTSAYHVGSYDRWLEYTVWLERKIPAKRTKK